MIDLNDYYFQCNLNLDLRRMGKDPDALDRYLRELVIKFDGLYIFGPRIDEETNKITGPGDFTGLYIHSSQEAKITNFRKDIRFDQVRRDYWKLFSPKKT